MVRRRARNRGHVSNADIPGFVRANVAKNLVNRVPFDVDLATGSLVDENTIARFLWSIVPAMVNSYDLLVVSSWDSLINGMIVIFALGPPEVKRWPMVSCR